ncbi:MAG: hypothetical protein AAGI01_15300 [Myxococcota bacterium]
MIRVLMRLVSPASEPRGRGIGEDVGVGVAWRKPPCESFDTWSMALVERFHRLSNPGARLFYQLGVASV